MLWDDFLNSKVNAFQDVLNSRIYIDKTGLLEYTNSVIDTTSKFICNSRPRRFGKSITADMMTAYYSRSLDTEEMFEKLNIGQAANQKIQDEYQEMQENAYEYVLEHYDWDVILERFRVIIENVIEGRT